MGKPAARVLDAHSCPMVTPGTPPVPHVGGPINGPGAPTVLIGGQPAALVGDSCTCVGPPDSIVMGSTGVQICGKPAARQGDMTAHGGTITSGCPTVQIGESIPSTFAPSFIHSLPPALVPEVGKMAALIKGSKEGCFTVKPFKSKEEILQLS